MGLLRRQEWIQYVRWDVLLNRVSIGIITPKSGLHIFLFLLFHIRSYTASRDRSTFSFLFLLGGRGLMFAQL